MAIYEISLVVIALAIFGAIVLPRILSDVPLSFPLIFTALGFLLFALAPGVAFPDPVEHPEVTERFTELLVIVALMGAGLKLDRPFDWLAWTPAWRLLGITMPLMIASTALLGLGVMGLALPAAVLLGAVVAPTDPVLASDVQATPPEEETDADVDPTEQEGSIRFALTAEAGLNDGLAFPFVNLAIVLAAVGVTAGGTVLGAPGLAGALLEWFLLDVIYQIVAGVVSGYVVGLGLAYAIFGTPSTTELARLLEGAEALAATLFSYGLTELIGGYGFIAVFVTAVVLRHYEWEHDYYTELHDFTVMVERLLIAIILVLFGGAIAGGLLDHLTVEGALVGLLLVFVVRPITGVVGMVGGAGSWRERAVISAFGIRGIGSFYYLSHALNQASFQEFELIVERPVLWSVLGFVVIVSMVVHGATATPVMDYVDRVRPGHETATGHQTE
jgi:NhaP-type Na+/H+ or K+/H+ antiporter